MKILVYGLNFSPELTGTGKYTGEMVSWLTQHGHNVRVVTAPPYYPDWKVHKDYNHWFYRKETVNGAKIYRCPLYVPRKTSTFKRLLHLLSFAVSSFFPLLMHSLWKPEVIICIAPTLFCVPGAIILSKVTKSKTVLHIQDFEVDAMLGLGMSKMDIFSNLAVSFEKNCLSHFDYVSTISQSMMNNVIKKGVNKNHILFFPNWSEVKRFSEIEPQNVISLRKELELPDNVKVVLYSGNIGEKQGLEIIIEIAKLIHESQILFLIVGQGAGKENLKYRVEQNNIKNIIFRPLQSYEKFPALLKLADCHLVIQRKGAADAVLPSKLTNILAVGGNAVITAEKNTELGKLCENYPGIALLVEPESGEALLQGIKQALNLNPVNVVAKLYAQESLDKDSIIQKFLNDLKG